MTIGGFNTALQKVDLQTAIVSSIEAKKDDIANLQAIQFSKGQTKKGGEFPYYSPKSVFEYGKPEGPWRLKDTGSLYASIFLKDVNKDGWIITANSDTYSYLQKRLAAKGYSEFDTFGLNKETLKGGTENPSLANEILLPELKAQINKQSGINLFQK